MDSRFPCTGIRAVHHLWKVSHKIVEKLPPSLIVSDSRGTLTDIVESRFRYTEVIGESDTVLFKSFVRGKDKSWLQKLRAGQYCCVTNRQELIFRKHQPRKSAQVSVSVDREEVSSCLKAISTCSGRFAQREKGTNRIRTPQIMYRSDRLHIKAEILIQHINWYQPLFKVSIDAIVIGLSSVSYK